MRDILLLLFVVGLIPLIAWRAWWGALAWTWIGLMNPQVYLWELRHVPFAMMIGVAFLVGWVISREKRGVAWSMGTISLTVFLLYVVVKTPFAWNPEPAWAYLAQ